VLQALHLWNNGMVSELAEDLARRIKSEAGTEPARQIERIYLVALGRPPEANELAQGQSSLSRLADRWAAEPAGGGQPDRILAAHKALTTYCHAILNSAEFLYVD